MIKNIIFDFGNVLLNLDESATYKALEEFLDPLKSSDLFPSVIFPFDRGEISEEAFFNRLQRRSKIVYHVETYYKAWNAMLLDLPPNRVDLLRHLKKTHRLFLLSNINITHLRFARRKLEKENNIFDFENQFFEKAYYSFEIGMRKPDSEIYQFVLQDSNLSAEESLFIDDKIENVEGAKQAGLNAYHHNPEQDIEDIIFGLLD